ncbi:MAG: Uma2 family endonuclease, partial [Candidatus Parabeggiatoa sp. nov. 3]
RADQEREEKEQALQRAARLAQILREQGIDPDQLG